MNTIKVKDKRFRVSLPEAEILEAVQRVADRINHDMEGKDPLFLGAFMFTADLMKRITLPSEIQFVKLASYQGMASTGEVKQLVGLNQSLEGRTVVIVEDIVDTGLSMKRLLEALAPLHPAEVHIATLLLKPEKLKVPLDIAYAALEIPNDFIVGYGLDYDGYGRNLKDIYTVVE